jgi:hypothetical protein
MPPSSFKATNCFLPSNFLWLLSTKSRQLIFGCRNKNISNFRHCPAENKQFPSEIHPLRGLLENNYRGNGFELNFQRSEKSRKIREKSVNFTSFLLGFWVGCRDKATKFPHFIYDLCFQFSFSSSHSSHLDIM